MILFLLSLTSVYHQFNCTEHSRLQSTGLAGVPGGGMKLNAAAFDASAKSST